MGAEHEQTGEMEFTGRKGFEQGREAADQTRGGDAPVGLVLGETRARECSRYTYRAPSAGAVRM